MPSKADRPDIEMGAVVKARKLRFGRAPETDSDCAGEWTSVSQRKNLPREVEPDVPYRDVELRWHSEARVGVRR
jgi:hypothetical protein